MSNANRPEIRLDACARWSPAERPGRESEQAWHEPGHPHQEGAVASAQVKAMRCAPERNIELMPQEEVLDFKLPLRQ